MKRIMVAAIALNLLPHTAAAMPAGLNKECQQLWGAYAARSSPKAFARGDTRGCSWRSEGAAGSLDEAKRKALARCRDFKGDNCRIVASE